MFQLNKRRLVLDAKVDKRSPPQVDSAIKQVQLMPGDRVLSRRPEIDWQSYLTQTSLLSPSLAREAG